MKEERRTKLIAPIKPTSADVYEAEYNAAINSALSGLQVSLAENSCSTLVNLCHHKCSIDLVVPWEKQ